MTRWVPAQKFTALTVWRFEDRKRGLTIARGYNRDWQSSRNHVTPRNRSNRSTVFSERHGDVVEWFLAILLAGIERVIERGATPRWINKRWRYIYIYDSSNVRFVVFRTRWRNTIVFLLKIDTSRIIYRNKNRSVELDFEIRKKSASSFFF